MTKLLCNLFVKSNDYQDAAVRARVGKMCGFVGIVANLLLSGVKFAIGLAFGLVSVTADAVNNLSDASSSLVTYVGFVLGSRPADKEHPFGHARYEYLAALGVAAAIVLLGVELAGESLQKIFHPSVNQMSTVGFVLLACSVLMKYWLHRFYNTMGTAIDSAPLLVTAVDNRNDVISSSAVLLGCVITKIFGISLDGFIGMAVAAFVLWSGYTAGKEAVDLLLGKADKQLVKAIKNEIRSAPEICDVHNLLVHDYGPGMQFASGHVRMVDTTDALLCHNILDQIERQVREKLNVSLVLHLDPNEE